MSTLNTIEDDGRVHYYKLCTTHKDWNQGDLKKALDFVVQEYSAGHITNMLEIGCGVGDIVPHLPVGVQYTGLDPTVYAINQAKKTYPQHSFVVGYAENLPFLDDSFDVVYSFQTVQMVRNPRRALAEIARVIRPGGYALLISPNLECPWSTCTALRHYSSWQFLLLTLSRCADLALRFFGRSAFRVIPHTYAEVTGKYEGKDCDLKHIVSTWEVMHYLDSRGFHDIGTRQTSYFWMRHIGPLRQYGGGMYLLMQKNP